MNKKQVIGCVLAILIILISLLIPQIGSINGAGVRTLGVLISFLVILVTGALSVVVTSLIFCALMPLLGVTSSFQEALSGFSQPIVFFTMASFGIAIAITSTPISKRVLRALMRRSGYKIERVILAVMLCTAMVSSVVSRVPTCAVFMAISLGFLKLYDNPAEEKRSGRAFMIAVPVASMIGGMVTPTGSSVNLLALSLLEEQTGQTITFIQWMSAGVPLVLLMLPLAWFLIIKIYKPAPVSSEKIEGFIDSLEIPDKMDAREIKALILLGGMIVFWLLSSWFPKINVMIVAMIGCCIMFLPGVDVLKVDVFLKENSWDAFFLVGAVLTISSAMIKNGVSSSIAASLPVLNAPLPVMVGFAAVLIFASLILVPVATSLIPIMTVPLISLAVSSGISPAVIVLTGALCAGNCYLLPLDTVPLITYSKGYYSITDMMKSTALLQICMVVLVSIWIPIVARMTGIV